MKLHHAARLFATVVALACSLAAHAEEVQVAVAANFAGPMKEIAADFEKATGHKAVISTGSTGKIYAQIQGGAPFEVFLSADEATPARLEKDGATMPGSRFTYAVGRLALWSADAGLVDAKADVLRNGNFKYLALAAPKLAPYGAAALEAITRLGLLARLQPRFVQGESIGQTFTFVSTGNAELGFVALSQIWDDGKLKSGSAWIVPEQLHAPIRQDVVLLKRARGSAAAFSLVNYLQTEAAKEVIRSYGYGL